MLRFMTGFILGYTVAKRPPDENDIKTFFSDVEVFFEKVRSKFT